MAQDRTRKQLEQLRDVTAMDLGPADGVAKAAKQVAETYLEIFEPDHFFIEVQKQGIKEQDMVNPELADLANKLGVRQRAVRCCPALQTLMRGAGSGHASFMRGEHRGESAMRGPHVRGLPLVQAGCEQQRAVL